MRALVTAGGTSEPIDDVRVITNLSSGRFGAYIANALVERGVQVTLLASSALMAQPGWVDPRVQRVGFGSFAELDAALRQHTQRAPELLFMAAAVSDYSPVRAQGKIRSNSDSLHLELSRNPKLLSTLRQRCGPDSFLVGFKLLSGVSDAELISVARAQLEHAQLDLTVANDLAQFCPGHHPVVLVDAQGAVAHRTSKAQAATLVVDEVLDRVGVEARESGIEWLHEQVDGVAQVRRLDDALALPTATLPQTELGGGLDEAAAAYRALGAAARHGAYAGGGFSVSLPDGALLLGIPDPAAHDAAVGALLRAHANRGGEAAAHRQPVYDGALPIGVWAEHRRGSTLWLPNSHRSMVRDDRLAQLLSTRRVRILSPSPAERAFWVGHGFLPLSDDPSVYLSPALGPTPSRAASAALVDPIRRSVLLGRRLRGSGSGRWAFPGGRVHSGETPAAAAARELYEETGLVAPTGTPFCESVVQVGDGSKVWEVHNHAWSCLAQPAPLPTVELDARWVSLDEAFDRELAPGMCTVLHRIEGALGRPA